MSHHQIPSGPSSHTSEGIWPASATFPVWHCEIKTNRFIKPVVAGLWHWNRGGSSGENWCCGDHHLLVLQGSRPKSHWGVQLHAANFRRLIMNFFGFDTAVYPSWICLLGPVKCQMYLFLYKILCFSVFLQFSFFFFYWVKWQKAILLLLISEDQTKQSEKLLVLSPLCQKYS